MTSVYGFDGKEVYFQAAKNTPVDRQIYAVNLKGQMREVIGRPGTNNATFSNDFSYLININSTINQPRQFELYTNKGKLVRVLEDNHEFAEKLKTFNLGEKKLMKIKDPAFVLPDGTQLGVIATRDALDKARQMGLDLVEVSPNAQPPVCKIMDYGKWKYEEDRKKKEARKNQARTQLKEVKFHANTDVGDYQLKMRNIRSFLAEGNKVKLTLMFRGRENAHKEIGEELLKRVCAELADVANVEQEPKVVGRSATGLIAPKSQKGRA